MSGILYALLSLSFESCDHDGNMSIVSGTISGLDECATLAVAHAVAQRPSDLQVQHQDPSSLMVQGGATHHQRKIDRDRKGDVTP